MSDPFESDLDLDAIKGNTVLYCLDCEHEEVCEERNPVASLCEVCKSPRLKVFPARTLDLPFSEGGVVEGDVDIEWIDPESPSREDIEYEPGPTVEDREVRIRGLSMDESDDVRDLPKIDGAIHESKLKPISRLLRWFR